MIFLAPDTIVPDRLFTHPHHTPYDARQLKYMITSLCIQFERENLPLDAYPYEKVIFEADGRAHRLLMVCPDLLAPATGNSPLTVVGFFGQRQVGTGLAALQSRDDLLVTLMGQQPGLLSYSTLELTCGNFANCVLFSSAAAKDAWGENAVHREVARELSPHFYDSIRLYNGDLPSGIHRPGELTLTKVKYLDYRSEPTWRAERQLMS